jgi:phospholipid/cholesterol/gamma-HCH transport system permease protein
MARNSDTALHGRSALRHLAGRLRRVVAVCALVGDVTLSQGRKLVRLLGIVCAVLMSAARPSYWRRTVRKVFALKVMSSGVEAIGIVVVLAIALGVLLVVQYQLWLGQIVQSRLLGPVLIAVVVRELGPLLVNLVVIARSGSAMAAELALMHVSGEDRVIEGQGLDTFGYIVVPRVLALVVSVFCLTMIFVACSFLSVYIGGQWIDTKTGTFWDFTRDTLGALAPADVANLLLKSTIPPLLTGCICCAEGLGAGDTSAEVPRACRVAVQRSVVALFATSAVISVVAYL